MTIHTKPKKRADRLKIAWVLTCRFIGNQLIGILRFLIFRKNDRPGKILVFRTGSIGDSICAMPSVSRIRDHFPEAQIHLLTNAGKGRRNLVSFEALAAPGLFDSIINYEGLPLKKLVRSLRSERYDLVVHLPQYEARLAGLLRDMVFFRFVAGIGAGWGWEFNRLLSFRQTQEKYMTWPGERDRLSLILQKNGIRAQTPDRFPFNISEGDRLTVNALLENLPLSGRPVIGIVPGAKRPQNRWPVAHFAQVVEHFCRDFDIFLIGGENDMPEIAPLLELPGTYSFCGLLSPVQSGLLMQRCLLVLSNDTGPMHLAYAFGAPVVALFSNRDFPNRWFPPDNGQNAVLRARDIPCSICLSETCANNICMKAIAPDEVISVMNRTLAALSTGKKSELQQK